MPTIFGIIRDIADQPVAGCKLAVRRQTARPGSAGADVRGTSDLTITTSIAGFFSQALVAGSYYLWVGAGRRSEIYVPETPDYILLADLFAGATGGTATQGSNWRLEGAEIQLLNGDTGGWFTPYIDDDAGSKTIAFVATLGQVNYRYRSDMLELYCPETNTWHAPYLDNGVLTLAADGATPFDNDRVRAGTWQLKDITTGYFRSWFLTGALGFEVAAVGPEEG